MVDAAAPADVLGLKAFARQQGWRPSYVTELKRLGRLVLTDDGKVRVAESLQLIADTRDPAKTNVSARHAAARASTAAARDDSSTSTPDEGEGEGLAPALDPVEASHARRRAKAQAEREEALARKALRDEQLELGQLLVAADVEQAVQHAAAMLRNSLENLPNTLAPELAAAGDEARCRVILQSAIEHALEETSRQFASLGRAGS